jgi:hypothetical protein
MKADKKTVNNTEKEYEKRDKTDWKTMKNTKRDLKT